jgi:hypothetical protein
VCGDVPGSSREFVLVGNHRLDVNIAFDFQHFTRDAWTFGAADPNSGTSVLLEVVRSFAELRNQGLLHLVWILL